MASTEREGCEGVPDRRSAAAGGGLSESCGTSPAKVGGRVEVGRPRRRGDSVRRRSSSDSVTPLPSLCPAGGCHPPFDSPGRLVPLPRSHRRLPLLRKLGATIGAQQTCRIAESGRTWVRTHGYEHSVSHARSPQPRPPRFHPPRAGLALDMLQLDHGRTATVHGTATPVGPLRSPSRQVAKILLPPFRPRDTARGDDEHSTRRCARVRLSTSGSPPTRRSGRPMPPRSCVGWERRF